MLLLKRNCFVRNIFLCLSWWDGRREFVSKVSQALASRRRGKSVVVVVVLVIVISMCKISLYNGCAWRVDVVAVTAVCERVRRTVRRGDTK